MTFKKIKPIIGLLLVMSVILGLLVYGIYLWPSGKTAEELMERNQEIKDSLKQAEQIK